MICRGFFSDRPPVMRQINWDNYKRRDAFNNNDNAEIAGN